MKDHETQVRKKALVWLARPNGQDLDIALFRVVPERGGGWHPITGSANDGEEFMDAAKREFSEETGIDSGSNCDWVSLDLFQKFEGRFGPVQEAAFAAIVQDDVFITLDPSEHVEWKWVAADQAEDELEHDFHRESLWALIHFWDRKNRFLLDLEWDKFVHNAANFARTEKGRNRILNFFQPAGWFKDQDLAQEEQAKISEVAPILERQALWGPLSDLPDVEEFLFAISRGSVLEARPLVDVRNWCLAIDSWVQFPREQAGKHLKATLAELFDPHELLKSLNRIFSPSGEILETATPKYSNICSRQREAERELSSRAENLLRQYSDQGVLQEKFHDTRSGRIVFPVRVSDQGKINGRVLEFSVSRQTAYVEPIELDQIQQKLRGILAERAQEEYEILLSVCRQIQPHAEIISDSIAAISVWDSIYAKGKFAKQYGGKAIQYSSGRVFSLKDCAHPLLFGMLPSEKIVRNSITFDPEHFMMLISGPNTGGKTVFLKTIALAALCARAGFAFPASESPTIPFFRNIFVDLGDPQSIEEHVSSFSGHVLRMRAILKDFGPGDLVILDELNSATDPEEGAALCQAFLDELMERCNSENYSLIAATTHDPRLKILAAKNPRVLNASIHFDDTTMMPSYRLILGTPGRSRALETAKRLGIQESVLIRAKQYLSDEHLRTEEILSQMEKELGQAEASRREANRLRDEVAKLEAEWQERLKGELGSSIEKTRNKLKQVLDLAQLEMRETLRKLQSVKTMKGVEEIRKELNDATIKAEEKMLQESPDAEAPVAFDFSVGDWVRVPKWKNIGEILEWDGAKAKVALGAPNAKGGGMASAFAVTVFPVEMEKLSDLEMKQIPGFDFKKNKKTSKTTATLQLESVSVAGELDLRGKRLHEAVSECETYLDRAYRSGRTEVLIIHGLGTGAIREGVRGLLKGLPYIDSVTDAGSGMGKGGASLVRFKG